MFYNFDTGKVKVKSFSQGNETVHEMRHYGSVVSTFRTDQPKTFVPKIVEQHFNYLTAKHTLKDPNKRFGITQLGVDIGDLYYAMTGVNLDAQNVIGHYQYQVRGFESHFRKLNPELEPDHRVKATIVSRKGYVTLTVSLRMGQGTYSQDFILSLERIKSLKANDLAHYVTGQKPFDHFLLSQGSLV